MNCQVKKNQFLCYNYYIIIYLNNMQLFKQPFVHPPQEDNPDKAEVLELDNEEVIQIILLGEDQILLKKLQEFHNLTDEELSTAIYFSKLREKTHNEAHIEFEERKKNGLSETPDEIGIGTYLENIEPQVRYAVINLRKKGYNTTCSGFGGGGSCSQSMQIKGEDFKDLKLSKRTLEIAKEKGVEISIKPSSVSFTVIKPLTIEELTEIWVNITDDAPDLYKEPENSPYNRKF